MSPAFAIKDFGDSLVKLNTDSNVAQKNNIQIPK